MVSKRLMISYLPNALMARICEGNFPSAFVVIKTAPHFIEQLLHHRGGLYVPRCAVIDTSACSHVPVSIQDCIYRKCPDALLTVVSADHCPSGPAGLLKNRRATPYVQSTSVRQILF